MKKITVYGGSGDDGAFVANAIATNNKNGFSENTLNTVYQTLRVLDFNIANWRTSDLFFLRTKDGFMFNVKE